MCRVVNNTLLFFLSVPRICKSRGEIIPSYKKKHVQYLLPQSRFITILGIIIWFLDKLKHKQKQKQKQKQKAEEAEDAEQN